MILDKLVIKGVKVAFAVVVSLIIGILFNFDSPYLTAITAVVSIQNTVYDTVTDAKNRLIGTAIGISTGLLVIMYLSSGFLISTLGLFLIIYLCNLLKLKDSIVQASIAYLSIILFPSPNDKAVNMIISISTGVLVSITANFIFSPFELRSMVYEAYYKLKEDIKLLCIELFTTREHVKLKDFNLEVIAYKDLVESYKNEYFKVINKKLSVEEIDTLSENLSKISFYIYSIRELKENNLNVCNVNRLNEVLNLKLKALEGEESPEDMLYNYHVDKLLDCLEVINRY